MPFRKDIVHTVAHSLFDAGIIALAVVHAWKYTNSAVVTVLVSVLTTAAVHSLDRRRQKWVMRNNLLPVHMHFPGSTSL